MTTISKVTYAKRVARSIGDDIAEQGHHCGDHRALRARATAYTYWPDVVRTLGDTSATATLHRAYMDRRNQQEGL